MTGTILPKHHGNCFGCGPDSRSGLHIDFRRGGGGGGRAAGVVGCVCCV
ncbi:hypothetical protein [Nocardia otitidiscaviarum]|nr:hypothetical protein [Nocardia otitidiscaviarum]